MPGRQTNHAPYTLGANTQSSYADIIQFRFSGMISAAFRSTPGVVQIIYSLFRRFPKDTLFFAIGWVESEGGKITLAYMWL